MSRSKTSVGQNKKDRFKKWIVTSLLNIPTSVYDVATKVNTTLTGLVKRVGIAIGETVGQKDFVSPAFDLTQIQNAYQTDGYVRQAVDKYVDLIFKAGYDIVGKNTKAVDYIKARFAYMAEVTGVPQDIMFSEITENIVKFGNALIGKARVDDQAALPPKSNIKGLDDMLPIGGYFVLPVYTFQVKRDKNGIVKGWQQTVQGEDKPVKFKPQDIIHIYIKRESGQAFAYPNLLSVIDDVRALREIEERVLHMIYRNVHPLLHVKVGSKENPGQPQEVDDVKVEVENMSVDGGMVTTDRVVIETINTKNVIDAKQYLEYFEKRVFTGLGVSETMMGRGDTSNRSTSDNQKEEAVDRVKSIQRTISTFITAGMINELLREGGFDPLNKLEDKVEFIFKDPDADSKIKHEAHAVFLYTSNAITEPEMRLMMGRDPIADKDRKQLWFPQYGNKNTNPQASNTIQPENQSGKKTSPKKQTNSFDIVMNYAMIDLKDGLLKCIDDLYNPHVSNIRDKYVSTITNNTKTLCEYSSRFVTSLIEEYYGEDSVQDVASQISYVYEHISDSVTDIVASLQGKEAMKETISAVFDVLISDVQGIIKILERRN